MDPLSDVLSLLKPRSCVSAGFDAGGDWALRFGELHQQIKCYSIVSGRCWLVVDGVPDPVLLTAGNSFVLPSGRPFVLGSDPAVAPVDAKTVFPPARDGGVVVHNGGGGMFLVGSRFVVGGDHAGMLLRKMPPVVHIRTEADQEALRWAVERTMLELQDRRPGSALIVQHLAHMMLLQALRLHLDGAAKGGVGWFAALADRQLGMVLNAVHAEPAHPWTLPALAARACMSRSTFARKFRDTVGETPMDYVTRWRMLLAAERLATTGDPVSVIAPSLGYESDSAFSAAFKRVMGCPPRQYGRGRPAAAPS